MYVLLAMGIDGKFLGVMAKGTVEELEAIVDGLVPICHANLDRKLPLKERLKLAPYYFPHVGEVCYFEFEDLDECYYDTRTPIV